MSDDELIARYVIVQDGEARLRLSGTRIWALIRYCDVLDGDDVLTAHDFLISLPEMDAALAYYRQHATEIDQILDGGQKKSRLTASRQAGE